MKVAVDGATLDVVVDGKGPTVLLLHGFPLDRTIWSAQASALAGSFRVVLPDLRGHGASEAPTGTYSMDLLARDTLAVADAVGARRFGLVGHSMGGYVAFALLRLAPDRVERLALVSSRAAADTDQAARQRRALAERVLREGTSVATHPMPERLLNPSATADVRARLRAILGRARPTGVAGALLGMADRCDARPLLPSLRVPALVLAGRQDAVIPPEESEAVSRAIPEARLEWCESSGHMPMMEEEERVSEALLGFLTA